jgi:hypothetical protein
MYDMIAYGISQGRDVTSMAEARVRRIDSSSPATSGHSDLAYISDVRLDFVHAIETYQASSAMSNKRFA